MQQCHCQMAVGSFEFSIVQNQILITRCIQSYHVRHRNRLINWDMCFPEAPLELFSSNLAQRLTARSWDKNRTQWRGRQKGQSDLELFNPRVNGPLGLRVWLPVHHVPFHRENMLINESLHSSMNVLCTCRQTTHAHRQIGRARDVTTRWRHWAGVGNLPADVSQ